MMTVGWKGWNRCEWPRSFERSALPIRQRGRWFAVVFEAARRLPEGGQMTVAKRVADASTLGEGDLRRCAGNGEQGAEPVDDGTGSVRS